jgi:hypothetical protein
MDEQQLLELMIWIALQELWKLIAPGGGMAPAAQPAFVGDAIPGEVYAG